MNLSSDLVRVDVLDSHYRPHLKVMATVEGVRYTSTAEITKLFRNRSLVKSIQAEQEQALYHRLRMQNGDDGGDELDERYK